MAYFKEVKIGYELTFEGEDTSKLTAGKIAVAGTTEQLTGFDDGVAFNYNMAAGATSVSVAFDEKVTGPAVGLNIQPMDAAGHGRAGQTDLLCNVFDGHTCIFG